MRQYYEVKQAYPDTLIFFRMGAFTIIGEDAKTIAKELDITLTARGKEGPERECRLQNTLPCLTTYLPSLKIKGTKWQLRTA